MPGGSRGPAGTEPAATVGGARPRPDRAGGALGAVRESGTGRGAITCVLPAKSGRPLSEAGIGCTGWSGNEYGIQQMSDLCPEAGRV